MSRFSARIAALEAQQRPRGGGRATPGAGEAAETLEQQVERGWSEHEHQARLIRWCREECPYPAAALTFAIPNGSYKSRAAARKFQLEGLTPGVPDLFAPVPAGAYHGLFIEVKKFGGRPSPEQLNWRERLRVQGYRAEIVQGWRACRALISEYLGVL